MNGPAVGASSRAEGFRTRGRPSWRCPHATRILASGEGHHAREALSYGSSSGFRVVTERDDWDRHWREYEEAAARNPAQEFRRRLIMRLLPTDAPPRKVVDLGSGTGDLAVALRAAHPEAELLGLELSQAGIQSAEQKVPDAVFLRRDLTVAGEASPEYRGWATHAVCSEVLEHVDDPAGLLANGREYLAPGCRLIVTVPGGPMTTYDRHIGHRRHFTPVSLAKILRDAGFEDARANGAGFPVFNLYRLLLRALGARLIEVAGSTKPSPLARAATSVFAVLLPLDTRLSPRGWQIVATARLPDVDTTAGSGTGD
jgi:trans-aconitate methyltransferase